MTRSKEKLRASILASMAMAMSAGMDDYGLIKMPMVYSRLQPWDTIHISKKDRKWKTPEQLQEMRREKYYSNKQE